MRLINLIFQRYLGILQIPVLLSSSLTAQTSGKIRVAVSIFPVYDIVRTIAVTEEVFFVIPAGANPHHYEIRPSMVKNLGGVDMFIGVHPDFDGWLEDMLPKDVPRLYLLLEKESLGHLRRDTFNPHIWLSPSQARGIARLLVDFFMDLNPADSVRYMERYGRFSVALDELDLWIRDQFRQKAPGKMIQYHPAWDYFAEEYGLSIEGTIEQGHGDEPSLKKLEALLDHARQAGVKVIVADYQQTSKTPQAIAKEIEGIVVRLDALGDPEDPERNSFLRLMRWNTSRLAEAFHLDETKRGEAP